MRSTESSASAANGRKPASLKRAARAGFNAAFCNKLGPRPSALRVACAVYRASAPSPATRRKRGAGPKARLNFVHEAHGRRVNSALAFRPWRRSYTCAMDRDQSPKTPKRLRNDPPPVTAADKTRPPNSSDGFATQTRRPRLHRQPFSKPDRRSRPKSRRAADSGPSRAARSSRRRCGA